MRKHLELLDIIPIFAAHFDLKYILYGYQRRYQQQRLYDAAGGRRARHLAAGRKSGRQRQSVTLTTERDSQGHRRTRLRACGRRSIPRRAEDALSPLRTRDQSGNQIARRPSQAAAL